MKLWTVEDWPEGYVLGIYSTKEKATEVGEQREIARAQRYPGTIVVGSTYDVKEYELDAPALED